MKEMGDPIRVLLVDDDALADVTATYLERVGDSIAVTVEPAPDAALDRLRRASRSAEAVEAGETGGSPETDGTETDEADGSAEAGEAAESVASPERVDCVVSGYDLPGTDGLAFLGEVRALAPDLPFVLYTGKGSEEIASEAISAGVTDYIRKGSSAERSEVLANRVENAVARDRAEREAEAAAGAVERLFERITDAFFALDDDWRFRYVNERAASFFERSPEALVGEDIRETFEMGLADEFRDAYRRAMETQEPTAVESKSVLRPGTWLESHAYPSEDGLSVYGRDVSERKRMEAELRDTKRKIEALYDATTRVVSCTTDDEIYDLALEAAEEILEFDFCAIDAVEDDELHKRAVSEQIPDDGYYETVPVDSEGSLAASVYRAGESRLVRDLHAAGFTPAESEYRSALTVPVGEFGVFQAVSADADGFDDDDRELTELLAAHLAEALRRIDSETRLRAERDRFAALFENVPNAVTSCVYEDGRPVVRAVNPAFEATFGWSADELVGEPLDDYVVPDDRREEADDLNERALCGEHVAGTEVRRATADGLRDFLLNTAPVRDGGTEASDCAAGATDAEDVSVYTDITDQKERHRELARQNERLDEFASVVSHDLRNPLNVAQGRVGLLADEIDSDHLDPVADALDRMDALVEDLLALARQNDPIEDCDTETFELGQLAADAWATVETADAALRIEDDATLAGAPGRVRQLLENLFCNAVEHAGPSVRVRVGSLDGAGFYVEDDGPGIPESERERVFERGFTTADDGTGFGLSIVADVVEAHGWSMAVGESEDGGARFEIRA